MGNDSITGLGRRSGYSLCTLQWVFQQVVGGGVWPSSLSPPRRCICASLPWSAGKLQERTRLCSSSPPGSLHTSLAEAGSNYTKPQEKVAWLDAACSLKSPSFTGRPLKSACRYFKQDVIYWKIWERCPYHSIMSKTSQGGDNYPTVDS